MMTNGNSRLSGRRRLALAAILSVSVLSLTNSAAAVRGLAAHAPAKSAKARCSAGAHTLAPVGSDLYPDTGNGGYKSLHTDIYLVYNAMTNHFLRGNHVVLEDRATQCLSSFSIDFERKSAHKSKGPDMKVQSVTVNGKRARFRFVQPTYPGDPHGWNDPNPEAHEVSQLNPVGGPQGNPLPPACSPELLIGKAR